MVPQFEKIVHAIKLPFSSFESQTRFDMIIAGAREKMMNMRFIRGKIETEISVNFKDHIELKVINDVNIINSSFVSGLLSDMALGKISFIQ